MTCIAACVGRRGRVYIGADSVAVAKGQPIDYVASPKAWAWGEAVIGVAGNWAGIPKARRMPEFRTLDDAIRIWGEAEHDAETCALVGWRGAIYYFAATGEHFRYADRIAAIGSGSMVAIGAMAASQLGPEERVRQAVRIASRYVSTVGGAITVVQNA